MRLLGGHTRAELTALKYTLFSDAVQFALAVVAAVRSYPDMADLSSPYCHCLVKDAPLKNWRATQERVDKFISDLYFTDVNLRGR